jgi:hypothetical protein
LRNTVEIMTYGDEIHYRNIARDQHTRCASLHREWGDEEDRASGCRHDLGRGLLVSDLLSGDDGPEDDYLLKRLREIREEQDADRDRDHAGIDSRRDDEDAD